MYQLKITKNTDALALQHFNNVKGRLLDDINLKSATIIQYTIKGRFMNR